MNALRATWYELRADFWIAVSIGAAYLFGPDSPLAEFAVRRYAEAEERTGLPW